MKIGPGCATSAARDCCYQSAITDERDHTQGAVQLTRESQRKSFPFTVIGQFRRWRPLKDGVSVLLTEKRQIMEGPRCRLAAGAAGGRDLLGEVMRAPAGRCLVGE